MCSKTLRKRILLSSTSMKDIITTKMPNAQCVATTTDCWSHCRKSYIGVTAHWINLRSLKREYAALACSRLFGSHTYDVIANKINEIHKDYKIQNKFVLTTTDNGSNFVKAFKVFSIDISKIVLTSANNIDEEEEENIDFFEVEDIFNANVNDEYDALFQLPPHRRCVTHVNCHAFHNKNYSLFQSIVK